jgi:hypothetical protein
MLHPSPPPKSAPKLPTNLEPVEISNEEEEEEVEITTTDLTSNKSLIRYFRHISKVQNYFCIRL